MVSAGGSDVFVAKYSAAGALIWAKAMGGTSVDEANAITVAADGKVFLTGSFQGTADFDPGSGDHQLVSRGSADIFVCKLDADGHLIWARQAGASSSDYAKGVASDANGNVLVTGYFSSTVDFDPGPDTFNLSASGTYDAFVWKLNASGDLGWAARLGGTSYDLGYDVAVTAEGNVVATGYFQGTADMDPGTGTVNQFSAGSTDIFVTMLDATGALLWGADSEARDRTWGTRSPYPATAAC